MIILALTSPRRIELLKKIVKDFEIQSPLFDESTISKHTKLYPLNLAFNKAKSVLSHSDSDIIIGADTVIKFKNDYIGKPVDKKDSFKILSMLSNKTHLCITGLCVIYKNKIYLKRVVTKVKFNKLSKEEINRYIEEENTLDKAGAYAIQSTSSVKVVKKIKGSYYNVMGLPLEKLTSILKKIKAI